jgi:hypothetical protein
LPDDELIRHAHQAGSLPARIRFPGVQTIRRCVKSDNPAGCSGHRGFAQAGLRRKSGGSRFDNAPLSRAFVGVQLRIHARPGPFNTFFEVTVLLVFPIKSGDTLVSLGFC